MDRREIVLPSYPFPFPRMGKGNGSVAPAVVKPVQPVAPVSTKPPEFKSNQEVTDWIKSNGFSVDADFGKLDIKVSQEMANSTAKHMTDFPKLKDKMKFLGSAQERNKILKEIIRKNLTNEISAKFASQGLTDDEIKRMVDRKLSWYTEKVRGNTYAFSDPRVWKDNIRPDFRGILVNEKFGKNYIDFQKFLAKDVASGFHPIGCDTVKSVMDHEFAHQVDGLLGLKTNKEILSIYRALSKDEIKNGLSGYANKSIGEFIAEAWAEYLNNPYPREISQSVGDIINSFITRN